MRDDQLRRAGRRTPGRAPRPRRSPRRAAVPRHPAWTAATAPVSGSASSSGTQSATWMASATDGSSVSEDVRRRPPGIVRRVGSRPRATPGAAHRRVRWTKTSRPWTCVSLSRRGGGTPIVSATRRQSSASTVTAQPELTRREEVVGHLAQCARPQRRPPGLRRPDESVDRCRVRHARFPHQSARPPIRMTCAIASVSVCVIVTTDERPPICSKRRRAAPCNRSCGGPAWRTTSTSFHSTPRE